jgi:hypothetical protein
MRRRLHKINQTRRRDGVTPVRPLSRDKGFGEHGHQPPMIKSRLRNPGPAPHGRTCPSVCERESVFSQPSEQTVSIPMGQLRDWFDPRPRGEVGRREQVGQGTSPGPLMARRVKAQQIVDQSL